LKTLKTARTNLTLEKLEERANPSSFVDPMTRDIMVNCGTGSDRVTIHETRASYQVIENGVTSTYSKSYATGGDVIVRCDIGNDYVNNYAGSLRLEAFGQGGNDTLIGDAGNDHLHGGAGNDTLMGYGGNDYLEGRKDYDRLFGMSGNDTLDGGDDGVADYLNGGSGRDYFQRDMYRIFFFSRNRDNPVDFQSGYDRFYG
jgi:Ca2+-binding RTX toxin-like protein